MQKVLFFAEAVTLAHIARPIAYIERFLSSDAEIHLACPDNSYRQFLRNPSLRLHETHGLSPRAFRRALDWGLKIFDYRLLREQIREDLEIIERVRPDVVYGDFRLSLGISARAAGIPYVNITNAYWNPGYRKIPPRPDLRQLRRLPDRIADFIYTRTVAGAFARHAEPFNRLRNQYGLPPLEADVRHFYTDGDEVLYADPPELFPNLQAPRHHRFIGPLLWSPPVSPPPWWDELPTDRPRIYLSIGSSGNRKGFERALSILQGLPVTVLASTGKPSAYVRGNLFLAPWIDGVAACRVSSLLVCNGGSMSCHQALDAGIPVLGLCSNMDQYLNMTAMEQTGHGKLLSADAPSRVLENALIEAVSKVC